MQIIFIFSTCENMKRTDKNRTLILSQEKKSSITKKHPSFLAIMGIEPIGLFHHLPRLMKFEYKLPSSFIISSILRPDQQS